MNRSPVTSSNVRSAGYDSERKELEIEFKSGTYCFFEVPQAIYDGFQAATSKGSYFAKNIKGNFHFERK